MSSERVIKANVKVMLSQYKLSKVTLDNLVYIIEGQGFEIIEYLNGEDAATNRLIQRLDLVEYARSNKAFTYKCGETKFVFLYEEMSATEKLYALAHEVGHIFCGHLKDGNICCSVEEEYGANEFAHAILHPSIWSKPLQWFIEHRKVATIGIAVLLVLTVLAISISHIIRLQSYYGEYYITESGTKYHEKECICVKDKTNIERLTEKQYYSGEYEPCQLCLPE